MVSQTAGVGEGMLVGQSAWTVKVGMLVGKTSWV